MKTSFLLLVCTVFFAHNAYSGGPLNQLDAPSEEALQKTKTLLTNPAVRAKTMVEDKKANEHDQSMRQAFGEAKTEEIYKISSDVMEKLVKDTGGDVSKMMEIMSKAQRDPASMKQHFSPEQLQKIQEMARQIDSQKQP